MSSSVASKRRRSIRAIMKDIERFKAKGDATTVTWMRGWRDGLVALERAHQARLRQARKDGIPLEQVEPVETWYTDKETLQVDITRESRKDQRYFPTGGGGHRARNVQIGGGAPRTQDHQGEAERLHD